MGSSILSSNAVGRGVAIPSEPGGAQIQPNAFDYGDNTPECRIYSIAGQSNAQRVNFGHSSFGNSPSALEKPALWPFDLDLEDLPTLSRSYDLSKRFFDVALAILISPAVGLLIATIAGAIAITSRGPIFFRHRRIGRRGREFHIWKFRTMREDNERCLAEHLERAPAAREEWRLTHKLKQDPRVTRLGGFLRKTSLDELPQIFNVFAGNMSFVGPRPIVRAETGKYAGRFSYYLAALPGITGLWQVSGRCDISYDDRVILDEKYVRQWNMASDLGILLKTPRAVFRRSGAY